MYLSAVLVILVAKSAAAYFDQNFTRNVTTVVGQSAFLNCKVLHLDNKTVSWVRHKDINLLTVGKYTYSADERFVPLNDEKTGEWTLQIKYAQKKDTGAYECQLSTTPPKGVVVYLMVVEPNTTILGGPDLFINIGSTINLTCVLLQSPVPPESIQWTHNNQEINYDSPRGGVSVITEKGETTTSYLLIQRATPTDSGKYSCIPSNANTVTVNVHILKGEHPAAMHHSGENKQNNVYCICDSLILLSIILSIFICKFYRK
ncbi:SPEG neighbor protein-like isoform X2 [Hermetia illucens]|uniref:SPEG neighbor protein-like isoform X2 n=1 Tax=Hermetia illucens TaxID=343691 RepID=UPI0018CC4869|nr:SPEG neighbor protein-like isoform X2 [Hermetia illucens]